MSRQPKPPRPVKHRPSTLRLTVAQRLRSSWTRWSLTRTRKRLAKEQRRLALMQVQLDSQHLLLKELTVREYLLSQHQQEVKEIKAHRLEEQPLPPPTPAQYQLTVNRPQPQPEGTPPSAMEELRQRLGLPTPPL